MTDPVTRAFRPEMPGEPALPPMLRRLALSLGALLATLVLGRVALHRFDTPVRELAVSGAVRHVQPDEVRVAALPALEAKLFALDLAEVRAAVERLPWVASARIDRQWPGRIAVHIVEREPFARWGASDALSTEGIVFSPGTQPLPATLPALGGAAGREREVMAMYGQLADRLSETPFALKGLVQDARGEWSGTTVRGVTLRFGRVSPLDQVPRLKTTVLTALQPRLDRVKSIDLRYANGFAVAWRDPAAGTPASETIAEPSTDARTVTPAPGVTP